MLGVSTPHEIFAVWPSFSIKGLATRIKSPLLLLYGEGEFEQSSEYVALSVLRYLSELTCPTSIHTFEYSDGWAASHCQIGGLSAAQAVIFDWLDRTLQQQDFATGNDSPTKTWRIMNKYHRNEKIIELQKGTRIHNAVL
jgi:hypothetical protein